MKTILIMSGKGGVGKSTIAVNLSYSLFNIGSAVGILDADLHGPNILKLMGVNNSKLEIIESKIIPLEVLPNLKVVSIAGFIENESAVIWRGPMKHNAIKQLTEDVEWGNIDYLIIDFPPGTGDEHISIGQLLDNISGAVIISTPQSVSLIDMKRCIDFCNKMNITVIGVIENMSGGMFGGGTVEKYCHDNKINFLGHLTMSEVIVHSGEEGKPFSHYKKKEINSEFDIILKNMLGGIKNENSNNS